MKNKKLLYQITYILFLLLAIIIIFYWYTTQNNLRIEERNKSYAADSARQTAMRIDDELDNALNLIQTYTYFIEQNSNGPTITARTLKEMESHSMFDALTFTDAHGIDYASDGQTFDVAQYTFYQEGIHGSSDIDIIFDPHFFNETTACFYTPVHYQGRITGVLRGAYLAEKYLQNMLATSYFGEKADVFLCTMDGRVIAGTNHNSGEGNLLEMLTDSNVIDATTASHAKDIFKNGGWESFLCSPDSKTDNLCVVHLPRHDFVLVQTFPKSITQSMVADENLVGIRLEAMLITLFIIYMILLLIRSGQNKKLLKQENQEMSCIIRGMRTLFTRFSMVDFETDTYQYLAGTRSENDLVAVSGTYEELSEYFRSIVIEGKERTEFSEFIDRESVINGLQEQDDLRYECHIQRNGHEEWEHMNIICLERKNGRASKVLFIRQNITAVKEQELRIQAKLSLAARKERQYRIAITSNAFCTFEFNLTQDWIENDITRVLDGRQISILEAAGLCAPCKASECFEKWKTFILAESAEEYSRIVNIAYLKEQFEQGNAEVTAEYWGQDSADRQICVRQSFIMTQDNISNDIMVMVVSKEITEQVQKQREQTQALQDALMQAQHANRAKTTFLSNMSHDIRTPMNAIMGFTTIAVSHIDNKEQVKDCLQKVLASSNHLLSLINDILDMSRIESGKMQLEEAPCSMPEILYELRNILQADIRAKQLELQMDAVDVLNEEVYCDRLRLNQILLNLLGNAVKFTPAGGVVSLRLTEKPGAPAGYTNYEFHVKDTGLGMSQEFAQHIFEPFSREKTSTISGIQGTGLGMAITKNIVDMMNGSISVESKEGEGTEFTLSLTFRLYAEVKESQIIPELEGRRALVVDDDFNSCDSVSYMLQQIGMRAEWTLSGKEAVLRTRHAAMRSDNYCIYMIDWLLPDMNGVEVARRIRKEAGEEAPIIVLTSYDWSDIEEEAKEAGVTAFCGKPLFLSALRKCLKSIVGKPAGPKTDSVVKPVEQYTGHILLAEDNELNQEIAETILTDAGFTVDIAGNGQIAVDMVKNSKPGYYQLVLMDVRMPVKDGYEATREIRRLENKKLASVPIIAMTANAFKEDKEEALRQGMDAHIAKPIEIETLFEALEKVFS